MSNLRPKSESRETRADRPIRSEYVANLELCKAREDRPNHEILNDVLRDIARPRMVK